MIEELEDRWILGLRDSRVVSVEPAVERLGLVLALDCGAELTVRGPVTLTFGPLSAPDVVHLSDEYWCELVGTNVRSAVVFKSGALRIVFNTGHHLTVRQAVPESQVRFQMPEVFDWSYAAGAGVMKLPSANGS